jgi:hypothetical protein
MRRAIQQKKSFIRTDFRFSGINYMPDMTRRFGVNLFFTLKNEVTVPFLHGQLEIKSCTVTVFATVRILSRFGHFADSDAGDFFLTRGSGIICKDPLIRISK